MSQFGKYQLLRKLAAGGMAEIYLACQTGSGGFRKELVIKRIHEQMAQDANFTAMFIREAEISAQLNHQNIVQVYDFGQQDGDYYLAMEFVDGLNLKQIHSLCREKGFPLPTALCVQVIRETLRGLDYAHRKHGADGRPLKLVHRDVSPQNILVSQEGEVKLADFGIARGHDSGMTEDGTIKGKIAYMSPEQVAGLPLDGRSDLFSLSIVLWELLANRRLFEGAEEASILLRIRDGRLPDITSVVPRLPLTLRGILKRGLATRPQDRYASAEDMLRDLDDFARINQFPNLNRMLSRFLRDHVLGDKPLSQATDPGLSEPTAWNEIPRLIESLGQDPDATRATGTHSGGFGALPDPASGRPSEAKPSPRPGSAYEVTDLISASRRLEKTARVPSIPGPLPARTESSSALLSKEWDISGSLEDAHDPGALSLSLPPDPETAAQVVQALGEIQEYLADQIAPIQAVEALSLLVLHPPAFLAVEIRNWCGRFSYVAGAPRLSELLFKAVEKTFAMGELKLLSKRTLGKYLLELMKIVLQFCPAAEREELRHKLMLLGKGENSAFNAIYDYLGARQALSGAGTLGGSSEEGMRSLRILGARLDELAQLPEGAVPPEARAELLGMVLGIAAGEAQNLHEFKSYLDILAKNGFQVREDDLFKLLGQQIAPWTVPGATEGALPTSLEAMQKLVSLARDSSEALQYLSAMVKAAISHFNEGATVQAAAILELVEQLKTKRRLESAGASRLAQAAHHTPLNEDMLQRALDQPEIHAALRSVLGFFAATSPRALLEQIQGEERKPRLRFLTSLLKVQGVSARGEASRMLKALEPPFDGEPQAAFLRQLLILLREIPPDPATPLEDEVSSLQLILDARPSALTVREILLLLGAFTYPGGESLLVRYLARLEALLSAPSTAPYSREDLFALSEKTAAALAALKSETATRVVIDHGLKKRPRKNRALWSCLNELASLNLSTQPANLDTLMRTLKGRLPFRLLGFSPKASPIVQALLTALSGTPEPQVLDYFKELRVLYPKQAFSQFLAKVLAQSRSAGAARPSGRVRETGFLQPAGTAAVLERIVKGRLTGELEVNDGLNQVQLLFENGAFRNCRLGALQGEAAFFQMFQRRMKGQFALQERPLAPGEADPSISTRPFAPLIEEAMQRDALLRKAQALVPDYARLEPTQRKPSHPAAESSTELLRVLWKRASAGTLVRQCEEGLPFDTCRSRRVLAHWVQEESLKPVSQSAPPA